MLHKATSIKESSYLRVHFLRQTERKCNNNRTTIFWPGARFQLLYCMTRAKSVLQFYMSQRLLETNIRIYGKSTTAWSFSQHRPLFPEPLLPQASRNQLYSFMQVHTDTTLPTGAHPHPPSFQQPLQLCSPRLVSPFLSKEPDWGLGSVLWPK